MKKQKKNKNEVEKQKNTYYGLLTVGIIIFCLPLFPSLFSAIFGTTNGLCVFDCNKIYGLKAFKDTFFLISVFYKPLYIIGIIMLIISLSGLFNIKKK